MGHQLLVCAFILSWTSSLRSILRTPQRNHSMDYWVAIYAVDTTATLGQWHEIVGSLYVKLQSELYDRNVSTLKTITSYASFDKIDPQMRETMVEHGPSTIIVLDEHGKLVAKSKPSKKGTSQLSVIRALKEKRL